jgi:serine/threonine protein kinase
MTCLGLPSTSSNWWAVRYACQIVSTIISFTYHPNFPSPFITNIFILGYLIIELALGGELGQGSTYKHREERAKSIVRDITTGLSTMHGMGIIHSGLSYPLFSLAQPS